MSQIAVPKSRKACIDIIDQLGRRAEFIEIWGRAPEAYFADYSDREPQSGQVETAEGYNIWLAVLDDLQISVGGVGEKGLGCIKFNFNLKGQYDAET